MSESRSEQPAAPITSRYAPLTADGPLPPSVGEAIVSSAYRAIRPDLRAKQVLATAGIRPGLERASRVLRRAVDVAAFRAGEGEGERAVRPPLYLALYTLLKDHLSSADYVYREVVKPAEVERGDLVFLDAAAFRERVVAESSRFQDVAEAIPTGSEAEGLALFALAYALLQPDDAPAIVEAVASLGPGFRKFLAPDQP